MSSEIHSTSLPNPQSHLILKQERLSEIFLFLGLKKNINTVKINQVNKNSRAGLLNKVLSQRLSCGHG